MKKFPLILTLASSLLLAACGGDPVTSSEPAPVSSDEPVVSSDPASSEIAPVATTIADIASGKHAAGTIVTVSGIITYVVPSSSTSPGKDFFLQDGASAINVLGFVNHEAIVKGASVTVTGHVNTSTHLPGHFLLSTSSDGSSIVASSQTYAYETITTISSLEELDGKYGCYASLSPISYASAVEGHSNRFNAKYNDLEIIISFYSTIQEADIAEFITAVSAGTNFKYEGPIAYVSDANRLIVYSLDDVSLLSE